MNAKPTESALKHSDTAELTAPVHRGEDRSNAIRRRLAVVEPRAQRTFTPSLAVLGKSAGAYHWTPEGRKLVDFTSGVLVANLGHNPTRWWRRLEDYLGLAALPQTGEFFQAAPLNAYNAVTELEIEASERLIATLRAQPGGARMEQVLWAASGSEAIQKALWAALGRRPGAEIILATRHGFHGKKGLAGAVTGSETDADRDPRVRFISFPQEECGSVARRMHPLDMAPFVREWEELLQRYSGQIACVITEPYLGGGGSFHPQPEYLQALQAFCRRNDIVFILDEVQSNFGRTGPLFAYTHYGLEPDVVVLGKGLGNGVAVSAVCGPASLWNNLGYGVASDTWSANPLASAAVMATLDEYASTDVLSRAQGLASVLERGLLRLESLPVVARVRGEGVVWGVECAAVGSYTAEEVARAAVRTCYLGDATGRSIHLLGPLAGKVLRVSPPLILAHDEAEDYLQAMHDLLAGLPHALDGASDG